MNDDEDREKHQARPRKSRVTTNAAVQYVKIDYLKQKCDTEAKTYECNHDQKSVCDKFWRRAKITMNPVRYEKVFVSYILTMI